MANRLPTMHRTMATSASQAVSRIPGMRVKMEVTATGGSGADSTGLSTSLAEASLKSKSVFRAAIREIPDMQRNFTIMEDRAYIIAVIRDCFERHSEVKDPKIIDMLVFKAQQELREIKEQWKSRYHVYSYIQRFTERKLREEAAERAREAEHPSTAAADAMEGGADASDARREEVLRVWRERGMVPEEIATWPMFERWQKEEEAKFRMFALENKLFSEEQLDRAKNKTSGCTMM